MKSADRSFAALIVSAFLIAIVLVLSVRAGAAAVPPPHAHAMPDVLIWVDARNPTANWMAIIYSRAVSKSVAEADAANLFRETGWTTEGVKITTDSGVKSGGTPMTAVEFMTPPTVKLDSGDIAIEPIIKAFRNMKLIEIQYVMPQTFVFRGASDFSNKYVEIKLNSGNNAYRYTVRVKNPDFTTLSLPRPQAPRAVTPAAKTDVRTLWTIRILSVLLALMVAVIAFMVSVRYTNSRTRTGR